MDCFLQHFAVKHLIFLQLKKNKKTKKTLEKTQIGEYTRRIEKKTAQQNEIN